MDKKVKMIKDKIIKNSILNDSIMENKRKKSISILLQRNHLDCNYFDLASAIGYNFKCPTPATILV